MKVEAAARRWGSVNEVAVLLGLSTPTLYRAIHEGQFPAVRIRGRLIIPLQAVEEMLVAAVRQGRSVDATGWAMPTEQAEGSGLGVFDTDSDGVFNTDSDGQPSRRSVSG